MLEHVVEEHLLGHSVGQIPGGLIQIHHPIRVESGDRVDIDPSFESTGATAQIQLHQEWWTGIGAGS
ncbi:hypothetical protein LBMAG39_07210 [Cyanobium sp.]|nr:hypothetical protein LBMAG39_07210 [Cyanobium sp.]